MTLTAASDEQGARRQRLLSYQAPQVEDKLYRLGIVSTRAQASVLFYELKRYLALVELNAPPPIMLSAQVDAAWHQFVLYTAEYRQFCEDVWGRFMHHEPGELMDSAPAEGNANKPGSSHFYETYRAAFGEPPEVWSDALMLRPDTRLVRGVRDDLWFVTTETERALLCRDRLSKQVLLRTSLRAQPALEFIAEHDVLLLRELPALRGHEERSRLLTPLVEQRLLLLTP